MKEKVIIKKSFRKKLEEGNIKKTLGDIEHFFLKLEDNMDLARDDREMQSIIDFTIRQVKSLAQTYDLSVKI